MAKKYTDKLGLKAPYQEGRYAPWWMIDASKKCLHQFKCIMDKVPYPEQRAISPPLLYGTGVHVGTEHFTNGQSQDICGGIIIREVKQLAQDVFHQKELTGILVDTLMYFETALKLAKPLREGKGYAECPFRINYKGYVFAGRIDHVEVIDSKKKICDIWDFKCVGSEGSLKSAQLQFYAACLTLLGWTVRKIYFVAPILNLVKPVRWGPKVKEKRLKDIVTGLDKVYKKGKYSPTPNYWNCSFCNWGRACEYSVCPVDISDLHEGVNEI